MERRHLTHVQMVSAVNMIEAGLSQADVARHFDVSRSVISRLWRRYEQFGNVAERHEGRQRATTPRQDRYVVALARRNVHITARELCGALANIHNINVCDQTLRNRLHEGGLRSRRPLRVPMLRHGNRGLRLRWAQQHVHWGLQDWSFVLFTDEARFSP